MISCPWELLASEQAPGEDREKFQRAPNRRIQRAKQSGSIHSYLEEIKSELGDLKFTKAKNNLLPTELEAFKALKLDNEMNIKKAHKGTTVVVMNVVATTAFAVIENQYKVHRCSTRVMFVHFTGAIQM